MPTQWELVFKARLISAFITLRGTLESSLGKGPFKYYVIKEVGGWGGQMMMFDDKVGTQSK